MHKPRRKVRYPWGTNLVIVWLVERWGPGAVIIVFVLVGVVVTLLHALLSGR